MRHKSDLRSTYKRQTRQTQRQKYFKQRQMKLRTSPLNLGAECNSDSLRQFQLSQLTYQVSRGTLIDVLYQPPHHFCLVHVHQLHLHYPSTLRATARIVFMSNSLWFFRVDIICFSAFVTDSELLAYKPTRATCAPLCWPDTASCCPSV